MAKTLLFATALGSTAITTVAGTMMMGIKPTDAPAEPARSTPNLRPRITEPPVWKPAQRLAGRADGDETATVLVGSDNTCGVIPSLDDAPFTCNGVATCAFVTSTALAAVACCDTSDCGLQVGCVDYEEYWSSSACGSACKYGTLTAKCTKSAYPYCGTVSFFDGILGYFCNDVALTSSLSATTQSSFTPVEVPLSTTDDADPTGSVLDGSDATGGLAGAPIAPQTIIADSSNKDGSSTNVGAVVGGVVGGLALLSLIGLGVFFILRRNKNKNKNHGATSTAAGVSGPPGGGGGGGAPPQMHQNAAPPAYPQQPTYAQAPPQMSLNTNNGNAPPNYFYGGAEPGKPGYMAAPAHQYQQQAIQPPSPMSSPAPMDAQLHNQMPPPSTPSTMHTGVMPQHTGSTVAGYPGGVQYPSGGAPQQPHQPQPIYEAGGEAVGAKGYQTNHRGQFHEME